MKEKSGKIILPSAEAFALWRYEITGQLSDGHWENASPQNHWEFWCDLIPDFSEDEQPRVELFSAHKPVTKNTYALHDLAELLEERMLRLGRLARALPNTMKYVTFVNDVKDNIDGIIQPNFALHLTKAKNGEKVIFSTPQAAMYYATKYSKRDLKKDLRKISALMKTVPLTTR
jgi:hypothetical protein